MRGCLDSSRVDGGDVKRMIGDQLTSDYCFVLFVIAVVVAFRFDLSAPKMYADVLTFNI